MLKGTPRLGGEISDDSSEHSEALGKKFGAFFTSVSKVGLPANWPLAWPLTGPGLTSEPLRQIGHLGTSEDTNYR